MTTYDRPYGPRHQSRSVVLARHGIVATSHPLAAETGVQVLRQGGSAADAAIAANAVLAVVEPMSNGPGGDLFALYWDAANGRLHGLDACGRSPMTAEAARLRAAGLEYLPENGPLTWTVPGCVQGWHDLWERFGHRPWPDLFATAQATAAEGFAVSPIIAGEWQDAAEHLREDPGSATVWLDDGGEPPETGSVFRNPSLARTLERIAQGGADDFYRGSLAVDLAAYSEARGGGLTSNDLADHHSDWVDPVRAPYRTVEVFELPPSGQGLAVLQMLRLLDSFPLGELPHDGAERLHLLVECKKLAYADRARFLADPRLVPVPVEELLSDDYTNRQKERLDLHRAAEQVGPGDPRAVSGDTVYVAAVDRDGNACSLIQSIFHGFGSKCTPPDLGFALHNRGSLFSLDPAHPNCLGPAKRPFHTIIPAMVFRDGLPWFVFGVMGGDMQPQGQVQVLVRMVDDGCDPQWAGETARVRHLGSATPAGRPAEGGGSVLVESGIPDETIQGLRDRGHRVLRARNGFGGYQGIQIDRERRVLWGASDPRKDGAAVGF